MILAAAFYAASNVGLKLLASALPLAEIAFVRFLLGGITLWPILFALKISLKGQPLRFLILRGVFGTASFLCFIQSMSLIPLSLTMVLFYTFPIFAAFASHLLLGERLHRREFGLIAIGLVGTYILINPGSHPFNRGYLYGLLAGVIGALAMVTIRKARETNGPLIIYFYFCLVGGAVCSPFLLQNFRVPDYQQMGLLLGVGVSILVGQILMSQGFKFCRATEGSLFLMAELVFAGIAGIVFFKDPVTVRFGVGALLIIGSGLGLNWMNRKT